MRARDEGIFGGQLGVSAQGVAVLFRGLREQAKDGCREGASGVQLEHGLVRLSGQDPICPCTSAVGKQDHGQTQLRPEGRARG